MSRKIPPDDAFAYYVSLGAERSYDTVAKRYGVTRRAVGKLASNEEWQERIAAIERGARKKLDEKLSESLAQMNARHMKVLRFFESKTIEAVKSLPIDSSLHAMRAFVKCMDRERAIRGTGPTDEELAELRARIFPPTPAVESPNK